MTVRKDEVSHGKGCVWLHTPKPAILDNYEETVSELLQEQECAMGKGGRGNGHVRHFPLPHKTSALLFYLALFALWWSSTCIPPPPGTFTMMLAFDLASTPCLFTHSKPHVLCPGAGPSPPPSSDQTNSYLDKECAH